MLACCRESRRRSSGTGRTALRPRRPTVAMAEPGNAVADRVLPFYMSPAAMTMPTPSSTMRPWPLSSARRLLAPSCLCQPRSGRPRCASVCAVCSMRCRPDRAIWSSRPGARHRDSVPPVSASACRWPTARAAFRPRCGARSREPIRAPRDGKLRSVLTGCGAAWLARLLWEQEAPGSNPGIPTKRSPSSDVLAGRPCGSGGSVSNFASGSSPVRALCDPGRCWDSLVPVPGRQVADAVR
jgi:hypothetical protein